MNLGKRADARSRETEYAGLPKSIKLWINAFVGPGVGVFRDLAFTTILYNYGGYTLNSVSSGIIIPAPGLYLVEAQMYTDRISPLEMLLAKNSVGVFTGNPVQGGFYSSSDNGAYVTGLSGSCVIELVAGDILSLQYAYNVALNMNPCSFGVTKLGGQY